MADGLVGNGDDERAVAPVDTEGAAGAEGTEPATSEEAGAASDAGPAGAGAGGAADADADAGAAPAAEVDADAGAAPAVDGGPHARIGPPPATRPEPAPPEPPEAPGRAERRRLRYEARHPAYGALMRGVLVAAWALTIVMLALVVVRLAWPDRWAWSLTVSTFTFWVFLPAWVITFGALFRGRWYLMTVALFVVCCQIAWVLPTIATDKTNTFQLRPTDSIVVYSANVDAHNDDPSGIVGEIAQEDPDVVVLQEYNDAWHDALADGGLLDVYTSALEEPRTDDSGMAILSKTPFEESEVVDIDGYPVLRATVSTEVAPSRTGPLQIVGVHPIAPSRDFGRFRAQTEQIDDLLDDIDGDVAVFGDLEVSQFNSWLGDLEGLGLHSAHEERGRGWATTWPNGTRFAPPVRLDHALLSDRVQAVHVEEGDGAGSDHRPVITEIRVRNDSREV